MRILSGQASVASPGGTTDDVETDSERIETDGNEDQPEAPDDLDPDDGDALPEASEAERLRKTNAIHGIGETLREEMFPAEWCERLLAHLEATVEQGFVRSGQDAAIATVPD